MSQFYDLASLVVIPSGYKASTIYAQKPLTTDGQLSFTRASSATRVQSNGLIEKVRTNLALYSEQFNDAAYTKLNATVTANAVANPVNGAVTADKIVENTVNALHRVGQGALAATSGVPITFSFIAKAGERTQLELQRINTSGTVFNALSNNIINLTTGVVPAITGATSYGSVSLGNGWFRYYITLTPIASGSGGLNLGLVDGSGNVSYTGDGTSGAFLFGFQAEVADVMTDYIPTTTAAVSVGPVSNVPRLDYLGSSCPRLLLEPQRTNVITYSEQINNAAFVGAAPVTANAGIAPDGTTSADSVKETSTTAFHIKGQSQSYTSGTAYTFSFFAKPDGRNFARVLYGNAPFTTNESAYFNLLTGAVSASSNVSASMVSYGNGWWRCTVVATANASASDVIYFGPARNMTDGYNQYAGDAALGVLFWGIQQENSASYATSYIPTLSASVTRVADAASKTGISSLIGQTEGTLYAEINFDLGVIASGSSRMQLSDGTTSNWIFIGLPDGLTGNLIRIYATSASGTMSAYGANPIVSGINKIAFGYKSGSFVLYVNGAQAATSSTTLTMPTCSRIDLQGQLPNEAAFERINYNQALLFKTRLTNAQMAELTTL